MQRRGTNVVVGGDRQKLGATELDMSAVVKRNKKQITAVLVSLTVFAVLLSKFFSHQHQLLHTCKLLLVHTTPTSECT